jgi:hypothetical protein
MDCLVKPTCFNERKATKKAKYLRYTVELKNPCIDAILKMQLIHFSKDNDLLIPFKRMDMMKTEYLFDYARNIFNQGEEKTAYLMFVLVVERNPKYVSDESETPYLFLGMVFENQLNDFDIAIELYSKEILLTKGDPFALECRGFCHLRNKDLQMGLDDLKKSKSIKGYHNPQLHEIIQDIENRLKGQRGNVEFDSFYL